MRFVSKTDYNGNVYRSPDNGRFFFILNDENTPVAFAKVYENLDNIPVQLCDIETREGYRNMGYARTLLEKIAKKYNVEKVAHFGGYTPAGAKFIAKFLDSDSPAVPSYSDQEFMYDWDAMQPMYA